LSCNGRLLRGTPRERNVCLKIFNRVRDRRRLDAELRM
jgi:hypothetical protein